MKDKTIKMKLSKNFFGNSYMSIKMGRSMLCRRTIHELFDIPDDCRIIYLTMSEKELPQSYKVKITEAENYAIEICDTNYFSVSLYITMFCQISKFKNGCWCQISYEEPLPIMSYKYKTEEVWENGIRDKILTTVCPFYKLKRIGNYGCHRCNYFINYTSDIVKCNHKTNKNTIEAIS